MHRPIGPTGPNKDRFPDGAEEKLCPDASGGRGCAVDCHIVCRLISRLRSPAVGYELPGFSQSALNRATPESVKGCWVIWTSVL